MTAYKAFNDGEMQDYVPTDEEIEKGFGTMPTVNLK